MPLSLRAVLAVVLLGAFAAASYAVTHDRPGPEPHPQAARAATPAPPPSPRPPKRAARPEPPPRTPHIRWRHSAALGYPAGGRLARGVRLPAEGRDFFTWDPILRRSPNRAWRRWGTDRLIRVILRVAREHRRAHPRSPRLTIGDLSRPRGGDFGPQFGFVGHLSHQNGLDVDVYYPRADRRERAPRDERAMDRRLSQALVDRFVAHGAQVVFVGPNTGLHGPAGRVQTLVQHDNHLHVRLPPAD